MKKISILSFIIACLFVSGCNGGTNKNDVNIQTEKTENVQNEIVKESENTEKDDLEVRIQKEKQKWGAPMLPKNNVYVNEACGYEFEFPSEWTGWYFINDDNPRAVEVRFFGESLRGTILEKTFSSECDFGLRMFFILSEDEVVSGTYDNTTFLGTAKDANYYFATTTDVSLAPLIGEGAYWFDENAKEIERMKNDWKKAEEMMEFYAYDNRNNLSDAFRAK